MLNKIPKTIQQLIAEKEQQSALLEIRQQAVIAEAQMHERADKVMNEIELQHLDEMIRLDIEHKARMNNILRDWWVSLSLTQRVEWFKAWDDYTYFHNFEPSEFERSVFAFMQSNMFSRANARFRMVAA